MTDLEAGSRVGDYVLEARLGGGSFGSVWRARHVSSGQTVAIKLLTGVLAGRDRAGLRAEVELLAASASGKSPHVVRVLGGGAEPVPYVVMEYVEGNDLASLLREQGKLAPSETIRIGVGVADALCALNQAGIVHRDVKPANVMVDRLGTIKLTDFGIAKIVGYETVTMTGQLPMTMAYAAPEVWEGYASHQSDLYALGIVLYQCLTGSPPFIGNYGELYRKHSSVPPDMEALPAETPPSLREAIQLCLEKDAGARPNGAAACIDLLHQAEAEMPTAPSVVTEPVRFGPWLRREPHPSQTWAWRCVHENSGDEATVEVHFAPEVAYGAQLRKAVAANPKLVPLGAEGLLGTNRLILRPGEGWQQPPEGEFCFWVARDELPLQEPPAAVTVGMLGQTVGGLLALIDVSDATGVALSLEAERVVLLSDERVHVRRPGLPPVCEASPLEEAMAFLRGLPLEKEARGLVAAASDLRDLQARLAAKAVPATPTQPPELGVAHPAEDAGLLATGGETGQTSVLAPPLAPAPPEPPIGPPEAIQAEAPPPPAEPLPADEGPPPPPRRRWPRLAFLGGGAAGLTAIGFIIAALWPGSSNSCGLEAPSDLNAQTTGTSILLTWKDSSDDEEGFRVEVREGGGEYGEAAEVKANVTNYLSGPLARGRTYRYRVLAYNAGCESEPAEAPRIVNGVPNTRTATPPPTAASTTMPTPSATASAATTTGATTTGATTTTTSASDETEPWQPLPGEPDLTATVGLVATPPTQTPALATLTPSLTPPRTSSPTPMSSVTATLTPSPSSSPTPFATNTATPTSTLVPPSPTDSPSPTPTPSRTPTATPTRTPTPSPSPTPTPTPTPSPTPIPLVGNIAPLANIAGGGGCGSILTDGSLSATCHAGSYIQFSWSTTAQIHKMLLFNDGGVNWFEVRMSDGTFFRVDFGGPNTCVQVNFSPRDVTWVRIDFTDGIPSTMKEIEIWATTGPQSSGLSCSHQPPLE
jgi:serine/threonine-protein kinase